METITPVNNDIYETLGDRWYTAHDDPVALLRKESATKIAWMSSKLRALGLTDRMKLLDVGCGAGFLTNHFASENFAVYGLDISEDSLRVARNHDATQSVTYVAGDAYRLPYDDASFDVVTSMDFLEHVDRPADVIKEISRVLKPGGLFFFHTFNRNWLSYIVIIKLVEWFVKNTPKHMHVLRLFIKPAELGKMCEANLLEPKEFVGLRPRLSRITFESLLTGVVPENFAFKITRSLKLSYLGYAVKTNSGKSPSRCEVTKPKNLAGFQNRETS